MSVVVLGTVALDTIKTPSGFKRDILGGSAAHFAMAARLFTDVHLVAVIGDDFPQKHIEFLRKKGIIVTSLVREKGKTFRWSGEYRGNCNCAITIKTELGVLARFNPSITTLQQKISNIFLANIDPDIQQGLLDTMCCPRFVGVDSMNFWIQHKRSALLKLLKKVDLFVANDAEARDLSGRSNLLLAARALKALGPKMIIIKKGENGVLFYSDSFLFSLPAYPVRAIVDPTGAGDTFAGGLMGYLTKAGGFTKPVLKKALGYATVIASFNVEGFGMGKTSRLNMRAILTRLKRFKDIVNL